MTNNTQDDFNTLVGRKMKLLGLRAKDPSHPMHRKIKWDRAGRPILPTSDDELSALMLAALDEPEVN